MTRKRIGIMIGAAVAAGLGAGVADSGGPGASQRRTTSTAVTAAPPYSYYQPTVSRYYDGAV